MVDSERGQGQWSDTTPLTQASFSFLCALSVEVYQQRPRTSAGCADIPISRRSGNTAVPQAARSRMAPIARSRRNAAEFDLPPKGNVGLAAECGGIGLPPKGNVGLPLDLAPGACLAGRCSRTQQIYESCTRNKDSGTSCMSSWVVLTKLGWPSMSARPGGAGFSTYVAISVGVVAGAFCFAISTALFRNIAFLRYFGLEMRPPNKED